jgi:type IV secretion system protein VirB9
VSRRVKALIRNGLTLALTLLPGLGLALEVPRGGPYDQRVKFIRYNAAEVVKLVGH